MNKRILQGMETKKRIIECARELFKEKGYYSVTVDEIIKNANSSKGSFYTHFKSKEELLFNMIPLADEAYFEFSKMDIKTEKIIDKISLFIQYVFKNIEEQIGLEFISTIYSSQIKDFKTERFLIASERTYYQLLKKAIKEGQENNEIKQEKTPEHIADILTSCVRGVIYDWCLRKGEFNLRTYGMEITNMMLSQIELKN